MNIASVYRRKYRPHSSVNTKNDNLPNHLKYVQTDRLVPYSNDRYYSTSHTQNMDGFIKFPLLIYTRKNIALRLYPEK